MKNNSINPDYEKFLEEEYEKFLADEYLRYQIELEMKKDIFGEK